MTVVFVCTGNTCRSPMAAALMRDALHRREQSAAVLSAGLSADGSPAADNAVAVLAEWGLDLSRHRSRQLTPDLLAAADHLVVMTPDQGRLLAAAGAAPEKIRVLGNGIPDPYGGDTAVYRRTRDTLREAVEALLDEWFPEATP